LVIFSLEQLEQLEQLERLGPIRRNGTYMIHGFCYEGDKKLLTNLRIA